MNWITTYSGEDFDPVSPEPEKIKLVDIAHSLSLLCRGNGHIRHFYSVAQHSVNCALEAAARGHSRRVQLACLLHDASEAYMADVPRPIKHRLSNYAEIECRLQEEIFGKLVGVPLSAEEWAQVGEIDDAMLVCEFHALMNRCIFEETVEMKGRLDFGQRAFGEVERQYIDLYEALV